MNLRARISGSRPPERQVRDRLFAFYDWCAQRESIPELGTLARTVSSREGEIVTAVLTGVTNGGNPTPMTRRNQQAKTIRNQTEAGSG